MQSPPRKHDSRQPQHTPVHELVGGLRQDGACMPLPASALQPAAERRPQRLVAQEAHRQGQGCPLPHLMLRVGPPSLKGAREAHIRPVPRGGCKMCSLRGPLGCALSPFVEACGKRACGVVLRCGPLTRCFCCILPAWRQAHTSDVAAECLFTGSMKASLASCCIDHNLQHVPG